MPETSLDPDLALLGPGSEVPTLDTIRKLADLLDGAHWGQFIVERPALLRPSIILALAEEARALSEAESERLLRALQMCAGGYSRFEHQREKYPVGNGPIEAIFTRVQHGEISMDYGKRLAAKLGAVGLISLAYFRALSWYALTSLAQAGDWQRALTMEGLLLAACDAADPTVDDIELVITETHLDFLLTGTQILMQIPDGRVFKRAVNVGTDLIKEYAKADNSRQLGHALHRMGSLHLDPYTAQTTTVAVELFVSRFPNRLAQLLGPDAAILGKELAMPPLREALASARGYYERALEHREGHMQGMTLKALAQTLLYQRAIGEHDEKQEITSLLNRALALLDPGEDPQHRAWVHSALASLET